jgi:hypothetical protein
LAYFKFKNVSLYIKNCSYNSTVTDSILQFWDFMYV